MTTAQTNNIAPKVSVIVPAYNAERTINEALASALAQTEDNLEVIVCDDCSADGTRDVALALDDPRVRVIRNDANLGEGASRDRTIAVAKGAWIALLDADDAWQPQRLEKMLRAAGERANTMIFDDVRICYDVRGKLRPVHALRGHNAFGAKGAGAVDVEPARWARSPQFLIKPLIPLDALRASGVRHSNLRFGEDTEFFLRLVASGMHMRYVPQTLYLYRVTPGSASASPHKARLMRNMLAALLPLYAENPEMLAALERKIGYRDFTIAIKAGRLDRAARLAMRKPSFLAELASRSTVEMLYGLHRKWRGGASR